MAATWTSERFPQFAQAIRQLTAQHRELTDAPLHLAIAYGPPHDTQDIFLFEVIGASDGISLNSDRDLFETVFEPTPRLATGFDQRLHLVLTTPPEFETALREGWPLANEVVNAIQAGDYEVLYADAIGERTLESIRSASGRQAETARG